MSPIDSRVTLSSSAYAHFLAMGRQQKQLVAALVVELANDHESGLRHLDNPEDDLAALVGIECSKIRSKWGVTIVYGIFEGAIEIDGFVFDPSPPNGASPGRAGTGVHIQFIAIPEEQTAPVFLARLSPPKPNTFNVTIAGTATDACPIASNCSLVDAPAFRATGMRGSEGARFQLTGHDPRGGELVTDVSRLLSAPIDVAGLEVSDGGGDQSVFETRPGYSRVLFSALVDANLLCAASEIGARHRRAASIPDSEIRVRAACDEPPPSDLAPCLDIIPAPGGLNARLRKGPTRSMAAFVYAHAACTTPGLLSPN